MSTFANTAAQEKGKPDRIVVLGPELFAHDWKGRPRAEVAVGLRVISEKDVQVGRAEASKYMVKMFGLDDGSLRDREQAFACWNDRWLAYAIGCAACDPNDSKKPYFQLAEEDAIRMLSSEGLHRLWDEYMLIARGTGDRRQISDGELLPLAKSLVNVGALEEGKAREVRKHLAWVAGTLEEAGLLLAAGAFDDEDGDGNRGDGGKDDEDKDGSTEDSVYVIKADATGIDAVA